LNAISTVGSVANPSERPRLHIVFASTSGHTEYVVDTLINTLNLLVPDWEIEKSMAERTHPQDLLRGDLLLLASSTWNTWSVEGQLNPHMWELLQKEAKELDLAGKPSACVGLGDHRYFYTARAADRLQQYIETHRGRLILPTLKIVDEPYGQEDVVGDWAKQLLLATTRTSGV
jgi:flavodoxin I